MFKAVAGSSGSNTISVHNAANTTSQVFINEFSGAPLQDQFASAFGSGTAVDSGGVTTLVAAELLFGLYIATGAAITQTPGTGWTALDHQGASQGAFTQYQVVASTGTYDTTATLGTGKSGTPSWAAFIVTFSNVALAFPSGVSCSSAVGSPTGSGSASASASGVSASSAVGSPTGVPGWGVNVTGVSAVSAVNAPFTSGGASVSPSGVSSTASVGTTSPLGINNASTSGVSATSGVNTPSGSGSGNASPAGLRATSAAGTPSASGAGNAAPSGVATTSHQGTVAATGNWYLSITGISVISETLSVGGFSVINDLSITGFTVTQG